MDLKLGKQIVNSTIDTLSLFYDDYAKIETFKQDLKRIEKKAKKLGYTNVRVELRYNEGDENNLSRTTFAVTGDKLETDQEWHRRLEHEKIRNKRVIEETLRNHNVLSFFQDIDKQYEDALKNSPLKCITCGKPTAREIHSWGKTRRICHECDHILDEKMRKKLQKD